MALGNFVLGYNSTTKPQWDDTNHQLVLGAKCYAKSEGKFEIGQDGSYTVSAALKRLKYEAGDNYIITATSNYACSNSYDLFNIQFSYAYLCVYIHYPNSYRMLYNVDGYGNIKNLVIDLTYDAPNKIAKLYINGVLVANYTWSSATILSPDAYLTLHGITLNTGSVSTYSSDTIGYYAINIYNRVLIPEEIEQNFNTYNSRFSLGL